MEFLINIANVLYLASYFTRDMLSLRLCTVVAAACLSVYFYCQPDPLMTAVYWNSFFIALNFFRIARLVRERRARWRTAVKSCRGIRAGGGA